MIMRSAIQREAWLGSDDRLDSHREISMHRLSRRGPNGDGQNRIDALHA
jgi:hypothetical protein